MKKIEKKYNVSRGTIQQLREYESTLQDWQSKMNLVSNSSLDSAWERHFEDSVQLFDLLPSNAETLFDFGSGAGFPGMVLAIMAKELLPNLQVNLVESTKKKTLYLKHVSDLTDTKVNIYNDRIENIKNQKADVITSRAMSSLNDLLNYSEPFCKKNTILIFPKGKKHQAEIDDAKRNWGFDIDIFQSSSSDEGAILVLTNLKRRK